MDKFREYGKTGLFRFNTGWIYEEFLRELQGRKGVEVYKEMAENDKECLPNKITENRE